MFEGIGPNNKLFPRKSHVTLKLHGSRPTNRLKLKSIKYAVELRDNELGSSPYNWFLERSNQLISSFQSHSGILYEILTFFKLYSEFSFEF